ncbi:hypothetical protein [Spirosoma endbachense]|uniref:Uncharacterized protein n=1 Tax=Spirosoma endbachense TaxID=2666025 RepID=A0A6P1VMV1_9BACT|nr:hypothetical protein [Spirosoma endbachense]QHV94403.1 hypothetical protein GJR95_04935 [Spirosoma endbachense]
MYDNVNRKTGKLINWITVWGFIIACIAFNKYVDYRHQRQEYRAQYNAESRRADSLLVEKKRLEQRLRELENTTSQGVSVIRQGNSQQKVAVANAL